MVFSILIDSKYILMYNNIVRKGVVLYMKNKGIKKNLKVLLSIALLLLLFCMAAIILPLFTNNTATKTLVDICPDLESDGLIAQVWWINARIKTP